MSIQDYSIKGINQYYETQQVPIYPPVFTYSEENFDLDFGLLTEYMIEDDKNMYNNQNIATVSGASSDEEGYSSNEDGMDKKKRYTSGDLKPRSKEQMDRRRERNRILAKKTRLRKKFFFESLQRQVAQLSTENEMLKSIVKQRMTNEVKLEILSQCRTEIPSIVATSAQQATSLLEKADYRLMAAIHAAQRSFVITDPSLPDNPIIFAATGFLELSGYRLDEVLGRNCRFMQGPKTDQSQVEVLRNGINKGIDTAVCLLNYKRNGTPFYNQIFVAALRDSNSKIINYVGVQVEIQNYEKIEQNNKITMQETELLRKANKQQPQIPTRKVNDAEILHTLTTSQPKQAIAKPRVIHKVNNNTTSNQSINQTNSQDNHLTHSNSINSLLNDNDSNYHNRFCDNIGLDDLFHVFDENEQIDKSSDAAVNNKMYFNNNSSNSNSSKSNNNNNF